jgi:Icc-related predicted phosphoesterase
VDSYFTKSNPYNLGDLFISDIHGRSKKLERELSLIARTGPPKMVFFLGDIVGTDKLAELQKLFYNRVFNHIKNTDLASITDKEILDITIDEGQGDTVEDGCSELLGFLQNLKPGYNRKNHGSFVKELGRYSHFGHFASNLPEGIRVVLEKDMKKNAAAIIDIMTEFTDKGSSVVVVEGNWDARHPLDFYKDKRLCKPLPVEDRSFYFKDFLKSLNNKVLYFNEPGIIEKEDKIFVLWPFDAAIKATQIPEFTDEQQEKKIILISHAQIEWAAIKGNTPMTAEGKKIEENMKDVFNQSQVAVHGHLHQDIYFDGYFSQRKEVHYLPLQACRFIDL